MNLPYELQVGWRYTRASRVGRHNGFISFISGASMLGIALGVAALIIVLSVMNGFQKEVRDRMLSVVPHIEVFQSRGEALADWRALASRMRENHAVVGTAPFIAAQALIARGDDMRGAVVRGISPADEATVTELVATDKQGVFTKLKPGAFGVVLGVELARTLGVKAGDSVAIVANGSATTSAGVVPRLKQLTVVGTFDAGHFEYDSALAFVHVDDAAELFKVQGPIGVQLRIKDMNAAHAVAEELAATLGSDMALRDWTLTNRNWFEGVQVQKRLMVIILTLIVAVAAFNLVSTLVMTVTDKQADIAILRTLGASPKSIMGIFMVQGAASGVIGTLSGVALGLLVAFNLGVIVPAIEHALGMSLLKGSVYLITHMPSDPQAGDIIPVALTSLVLSFIATLYPSWRASRLQPALALRYE